LSSIHHLLTALSSSMAVPVLASVRARVLVQERTQV
jgi:hypothetical protein